MKQTLLLFSALLILLPAMAQKNAGQLWPDGSTIPAWYRDTTRLKPHKQHKRFLITNYGAVQDSTLLQTAAIQKTIDEAARKGGGVVVIPAGTYLSGALFFKPKTSLLVEAGARLKGSDNIADYPKIPSRMEGQNLNYFAALINAYGVHGFSISGGGTIDGNGAKYWEAFWQRRKDNPKCTNLEVSRPRLLFIWGCRDVRVEDVVLQNAGFWTSHYYQCQRVKIMNVRITSPHKEQKAPSTDAIDLDVCRDVLIRGCYLSVNDDAIALKGGKGPWADTVKGNGENVNIIIENCTFGFCHSALTLGSESIHNRNVLMRHCQIDDAKRALWLKLRPDTRQHYEYVRVEHLTGNAGSLIYAKPWTQFFDLQGRKGPLPSVAEHISLADIKFSCKVFFDVEPGTSDSLRNFTFSNLDIDAANARVNKEVVAGFTLKNVRVNGSVL